MTTNETSPTRVEPDKVARSKYNRDDILTDEQLEARIRAGELTRAEADELLQAAASRETAEHGPALDTDADGTTTQSGRGTGQGMDSQSRKHGKHS